LSRNDPNVFRVELVAQALESIWDEFVLVGGCAAGLLVTDSASPPVRPTEDVDLVAAITTKVSYYEVSKKLRVLGFSEGSEVICRWTKGPMLIDVMPTEEAVLGFSNRWYGLAASSAVTTGLPSGRRVRLITAPLFLATKLDAFGQRGEGRYSDSHDIEDIVNVVDGRHELVDEVLEAQPEVREFLREEFEDLLLTDAFLEAIAWHLHTDAASQARKELIIARLRRIAGM